MVIKLLIELQKFQKIHKKIIQIQLQMRTIKKYLKKDIYLQKKDKKLFDDLSERQIFFDNSMIMEYQNIIHLLDNTPNQPIKFRTQNWVEINDESRGSYGKFDLNVQC